MDSRGDEIGLTHRTGQRKKIATYRFTFALKKGWYRKKTYLLSIIHEGFWLSNIFSVYKSPTAIYLHFFLATFWQSCASALHGRHFDEIFLPIRPSHQPPQNKWPSVYFSAKKRTRDSLQNFCILQCTNNAKRC